MGLDRIATREECSAEWTAIGCSLVRNRMRNPFDGHRGKLQANKGGGRAKRRRLSVQHGLGEELSGGITTHGAKLMARSMGGNEATCTVQGHYLTFVFEFPGSRLTSEEPIAPVQIPADLNACSEGK